MSFNIGDNLYKFTLLKKLGGNFGEVWHATDNSINKEVALKILEPEFEPIARLLDEARIGNKFNHKNLLPIHYADVATIGGTTYTLISQEYYKNGSVINLLNAYNFLPLPIALKVLQDILFGLEYLHNSGFYHNDIKPGNILIDDQNNAVLADYGITGFSPNITPITPKNSYKVHRAPETAGGTPIISIHSDIFQVGCTAYRLLNGITHLKNEFNSMSQENYESEKAKGKIPNRSGYQSFVPQRLKAIINKSLNVNPEERFSSALEMRRKLEKLSFPGYWTTDENSNLVGVGKKYLYQYKIVPKAGDFYDFQASKTNRSSKNITKVGDFTKKNLSRIEMEKLQKKFTAWVVENAS